jgi:glycine cleavage system H protein
MSQLDQNKYTAEHEWVYMESPDIAIVGITDYAQFHLGDIVYVDLASPGIQVEQLKKMGEIESVKAVSELFAPISGEILEVNQNIIVNPALVNQSPYDEGWLVKIKPNNLSELEKLMDVGKYNKLVATLSDQV